MKNLAVLLVDDEKEFVAALADRLKLRGIDVEVALDGEEALSRIESHTFDVLVCDLLMPGMDGISLMKQVKRQGCLAPVILLTGHGSSKEGIEGMKHGAYDYLMKPVAFEELFEKIRAAAEK